MRSMNRGLLAALALSAVAGIGGAVSGATTIASAREAVYTPPSRGKGKGKSPHGGGGTRAYQRAAQKKRNQTRNRNAHRG